MSNHLNSKYPFPTNAQEMLAALQRCTDPLQWKMQFVRTIDSPNEISTVFFIENELTDMTPYVSCSFGGTWINFRTRGHLYDIRLDRLHEHYGSNYSWQRHIGMKVWYRDEMRRLLNALEVVFPPLLRSQNRNTIAWNRGGRARVG